MLNKVLLIGRVTKKPITNVYANDTKVSRFSLAVDKFTKNNTDVDFLNIVVFGKLSDFADNYLDKGSLILVEGKITTSNYVNKENQKIYRTDIIGNLINFLPSTKRATFENKTTTLDPLSNEMYNNFKTEIPVEEQFGFSKKTINKEETSSSNNKKEETDWEV